ncbi:MAG: hypothetical protein ACTSU2_00255 [Promethearchaeota archaeon]
MSTHNERSKSLTKNKVKVINTYIYILISLILISGILFRAYLNQINYISLFGSVLIIIFSILFLKHLYPMIKEKIKFYHLFSIFLLGFGGWLPIFIIVLALIKLVYNRYNLAKERQEGIKNMDPSLFLKGQDLDFITNLIIFLVISDQASYWVVLYLFKFFNMPYYLFAFTFISLILGFFIFLGIRLKRYGFLTTLKMSIILLSVIVLVLIENLVFLVFFSYIAQFLSISLQNIVLSIILLFILSNLNFLKKYKIIKKINFIYFKVVVVQAALSVWFVIFFSFLFISPQYYSFAFITAFTIDYFYVMFKGQ